MRIDGWSTQITSWQWSFLAPRRRWWKRGSDRRLPVIGSSIPAPVSGSYYSLLHFQELTHHCSSFRFLLIPSAVSSNIHPCSSFRCSFIPAPDLGTYPSLLMFHVHIHPCSNIRCLFIPVPGSHIYSSLLQSQVPIHPCSRFRFLSIPAPISSVSSSLLQI